jgi:hypothetical protein
MATREELYTALRNADKAGDVEGARKLAGYIQSLPAEGSAAPAAPAPKKPESSMLADIGQGAANLAAGAVRGAGSIGATLLAPIDIASDALAGKGLTLESNRERRAKIDSGLRDLGADPDSILYKAGKLGGEVAGTAGAGGALANGMRAAAPILTRAGMGAPTLQSLASSVASGGFNTGAQAATTAGGRIADIAMRGAGGAISGGASAALIDPENAGAGAIVGAALPGAVKAGGVVGRKLEQLAHDGAERLMQSAVKPTIKQLASGDADTAVRTLLDYGISPTRAGVGKLRDLVDDLNTQIADKIANSTATIPKSDVLKRLASVESTFGNQVSPTADLATIQRVADDFLAHPLYPGADLPVQAAQTLKQGTYKTLAKKYGQLGGAETEAQKGLARGLKEEIANAVPEVAGLNAEEAKLITTLKVSERRALMEMNKNPMGLAALAGDPKSWAMFMADRSAAFKALAARMVDSSANAAGSAAPALEARAANPLLRNAATISAAPPGRE